MRNLVPPLLLALFLVPLQAGLLPFMPFTSSLADFTLCAVLFIAVGPAGTLEGALGAFLAGSLADLLYAVHGGLFALCALILFILVRFGSEEITVRGPFAFAALCGVGSLLQSGLSYGLLYLLGQPTPQAPWAGILGSALLTLLAAPVFYWLSTGLGRLLQREDPSLLR
jgi:rod shape-determining protein MreD